MNAKDYQQPISVQLGGVQNNNTPSNVSTVTVNAVQSCKDITNFSIFNALNAVEGSWGNYSAPSINVTYIGKLCIWNKIGSGSQTFDIPICKSYDYMAMILTTTSCKGIIVKQGLQQLSIDMPDDVAWQVSGCFTLISKD
jgi:hypothetical protein